MYESPSQAVSSAIRFASKTRDPALVPFANGAPWWRNGVLYRIFPRHFFDGDGDGVGDFSGIDAKLDYLEQLGVSVVRISGLYPLQVSGLGFDIEDHQSNDPQLGDRESFRLLVDSAHRRGIRVLVDQTWGYVSRQHPWFQALKEPGSRTRDCFIWSDGDIVTARGGQPLLNWRHPMVKMSLLAASRHWLQLGADGICLDRNGFDVLYPSGEEALAEVFDGLVTLLQEFPAALALVESQRLPVFLSRSMLSEALGRACGRLQWLVCEALGVDEGKGWQDLILHTHGQFPHTCSWSGLSRLLASAVDRDSECASENNTQLANLLALLKIALPGFAVIDQGDELGLDVLAADSGVALHRDTDTVARVRRLPWKHDVNLLGFSATGQNQLASPQQPSYLSADLQALNEFSVLRRFQQLLRWRKGEPVLAEGHGFSLLPSGAGVLAFRRDHEGYKSLVFVFNLTPNSIVQSLPEKLSLQEVDDLPWQGVRQLQNALELKPYGTLVARAN